MRVLVAMSGGVDSSVVAGLLAGAGHEVIGVTLQLYDHGAAAAGTRGKGRGCCAGQDIHDARRVADHLGIAHYVIDAEARFRAAVIEDFARAYAAGETPVPCLRCNQSVKFADLTALAAGLGAERLATGHYVRRVEGADGPELWRARDPARDQSWFLFATTRHQLDTCLFPLGEMVDKAAVREMAAQLGLPVAAKPDSQDLCFVPGGDYAAVVATLRPDALAPGEIVDAGGAVLGRHAGIARYTVGQARRLGGAAAPGRVVVALDGPRRRVVVGPRSTGAREIALRETNWLVPLPAVGRACQVKLRAHDALRPAWITQDGADTARVILETQALPAPGQACVAYDGERVLGGGMIAPTAPGPAHNQETLP